MNDIIENAASDDQNDELAFTVEELAGIETHRHAVSFFDEKILVWIQELGREILQRADEAILDAYVEDAKSRLDMEADHDALLVVVATECVDHWLEVDPRDGEVMVQDDSDYEYKIYLKAAELSTEPWELAQRLVEKIEAWNEDDDDDE